MITIDVDTCGQKVASFGMENGGFYDQIDRLYFSFRYFICFV